MPFYTTGDNRFSGFNWIVSSTPGKGTHTSVQDAIDDSVVGQSILLKDLFIEDVTMKAGISVVAETESYGIKGKISCGYTGQSYLIGMGLDTNGDYSIDMTGSNATQLGLYNCTCTASDNDAIRCNISNTSCELFIDNVNFDPSSGYRNIDWSSTGVLRNRFTFSKGVAGVLSNLHSSGSVFYKFCESNVPLEFTGSVGLSVFHTNVNTQGIGVTPIVISATSGTRTIQLSSLNGGSASAVTIGAGSSLTILNSVVNSSTTAMTGAGTLSYGGLTFPNNSDITVSTQNILKMGRSQVFGSAHVGSVNYLGVENTDNTNSNSRAYLEARSGGLSGGDPYMHYIVGGGNQEWAHGIDVSDGEAWKLNAGGQVSAGTNYLKMTTDGIMTTPGQPTFSAEVSTTISNVTGDNTTYEIVFDTELFDVGGYYDNTTGQYSPDFDGRFLLSTNIRLNQPNTQTICFFRIFTSNKNFIIGQFNGNNVKDTAFDNYSVSGSCLAELDDGDIASVKVQVQGASLDVNVSNSSWFNGILIG